MNNKIKWPSKSQIVGAVGALVAVALQIPDLANAIAVIVPMSAAVKHDVQIVAVVAAWLARSPWKKLSGLPGQEMGVQAVGVSAIAPEA